MREFFLTFEYIFNHSLKPTKSKWLNGLISTPNLSNCYHIYPESQYFTKMYFLCCQLRWALIPLVLIHYFLPITQGFKVSRFLLLNDILKCMGAKHNFCLQHRYSIVIVPFLSIALDIRALYYGTGRVTWFLLMSTLLNTRRMK